MKKPLLTFCLLAIAGMAFADVSGTCGANLQWSYDSTTHALTITGSGAMTDYGGSSPWYSYRNEITSVSLPDGLTSIGNYAFYLCDGLTSVTIPESVTSIGNAAFRNCTSLTSVTIPESVTSIGREAFYECTGFTSCTIPNSVVNIGDRAFRNVPNIVYNGTATGSSWGARNVNGYVDGYLVYSDASKIQLLACSSAAINSITIPESVTSIGNNAFYKCRGLTSVTIPSSVTSIDNYAFAYCTGLTSVTIPNSVTSIGDYAFSGCTGLTSVTIPNSVTSIANGTFYGCTGLTSVAIPNSVTSIRDYAFSGCISITNVTIGNSVTSIGDRAFKGCTGIQSIVWNVTNYTDFSASSSSPFNEIRSQITSFIFGNNVQHIPAYLCYGMTTLTNISIPESVTNIGDRAFTGCTNLTNVTIGNSVTNIGNYAFTGCTGLQSIVWNATNCDDFSSSITNSPFYSIRSQITSFTFGNNVQHIPAYLCYEMTNLSSISIPNSVTSIGNYAFYNCEGITSIVWNATNYTDFSAFSNSPFYSLRSQITSFTIGNNVQHIPAYLCYGMSNLTCITIPNSVTSIGDEAFYGCKGLTSVAIPNSVTSITSGTFYGCTGLRCIEWNATNCGDYSSITNSPFYSSRSQITSFIFGNNVQHIPAYLCYGMTNLTNISIPESVRNIGDYAFSVCAGLTNVTIGNSVTSIGNRAFSGCTRLMNITIPESVTSVGESAFMGCTGLTSVTIPNNVTYIGDTAFDSCTGLMSVTILADTPPMLGSSAFPSGVVLYVPCGTKEMYQSAGYSNVQYPKSEYILTVNAPNASVSKGPYNLCEPAQVTLTPDYGYEFVKWTDGNTDNPRSVTMTQDITLTAEMTFLRTGHCGVDNALTWTYNHETLTLTISGDGQLNANYTYGVEAPTTMQHLVIEDGVTSIGENAFMGCTGLTSVTIGNSVTSIGEEAFSGCTSLTNVTIPNSVTSIGDLAFYCCTGLTSVTIGSGVTYIRNSVFWGCTGLTSVIWNATNCTNEFSESPFWFSSSRITSFTFGNNVQHIPAYLCYGMTNLTSIIVPNSVTSIGGYAFSGCTGLTSIVWNAVNCSSRGSFYVSNITSFTFGENVQTIPAYLCYGMTNLTNISIPNSVTSIGDEAFYGCTGLTNVTIGNSVTNIGNETFYGCTGLTSVTIGNSVTSIGEEAFSGCTSLTNVTIPNSVTSIGDLAFYCCTGLTNVTIPNSVTSIGNGAFGNCTSLTSVTIPESVTSIGRSAFWGCTGLTSVIIPNSVTSIEDGTFCGCTSLTSVTIGNSVIRIGDAFEGCTSLTSIVWDAINYPDYDYHAHTPFNTMCSPSPITSFTFGNNVHHIPAYLCCNLTNLKSINISNSVTSIGEFAFWSCTALSNVTIGNGVTRIEECAFMECRRLGNIYCYRTLPPSTGGDVFESANTSTCVLHVLANSIYSYRNAWEWCDFYHITAIDSENVETTTVQVIPHEDNADVVWPAVDDAATYELTITDSNGNTVCTLTFNAIGQLTGIAFHAPALRANGSNSGFRFNVTGLENGNNYSLVIKAKDNNGTVLQIFSQNFTTGAGQTTAIENVNADSTNGVRKVIEDGKVVIVMPDGRKFDASGKRLK